MCSAQPGQTHESKNHDRHSNCGQMEGGCWRLWDRREHDKGDRATRPPKRNHVRNGSSSGATERGDEGSYVLSID